MNEEGWLEVCRYQDLMPERGVAALVGDRQIALFRLHDGEVYAVGNADPFSGANVMSRGIVGSHGDVPTVASPMYKEVFDLRTGECLGNQRVRIPTYQVRTVADRVRVRATESAA